MLLACLHSLGLSALGRVLRTLGVSIARPRLDTQLLSSPCHAESSHPFKQKGTSVLVGAEDWVFRLYEGCLFGLTRLGCLKDPLCSEEASCWEL